MQATNPLLQDQGITGDIDAREAARRVVRIRLKAVELLLPLALDQEDRDIEHVHQLRVSSRRAEAALRTFAAFFPKRRVAKIQKRLRKIRKVTALARECDVFSEMIGTRLKRPAGSDRPALKDLRRWTKRQRKRSQKRIRRTATPDEIERLRTQRERLLDRMPESAPDAARQTFAMLAREVISRLVQGVERAQKKNLTRIKHLHRLRIRCKRLRYALEIFRPCLESPLHDELERMKSIQDRLGDINDVDGLIAWTRAFEHKDDANLGAGLTNGPTNHEAEEHLVSTLLDERNRLAREFTTAATEGNLADFPGRILALLPDPPQHNSPVARSSVPTCDPPAPA